MKSFQAGQGGVVRSNDGALGTKLGQLLSALYVCPFLRGLCSQPPNLLLETETIFNPNFSNSSGQLFQGNSRPVCDIWSHCFKVREWDGPRERNPGVSGGGVLRDPHLQPEATVATLEGLEVPSR